MSELPVPVGGERPVDASDAGHLLAQAFTDGGRQRVDLIAWEDGSFTVSLIDLDDVAAAQLAGTPAAVNLADLSQPEDFARPTIWSARDAEDGARRMMDLTRRRPMLHGG